MNSRALHLISVLSLFTLSLVSTATLACTSIQLKAKDSSVVNARTVEFGIPLDLSGLIIPRNYSFNGTLPDGSNGMAYKTKYAAVGGGMFGEQAVADGLNEIRRSKH